MLHPDGCSFRALVRDTMQATRLPFEVGGEAFGPELQLSLVARGVGLGLVTSANLEASPIRKSVRVIPVKGFRPRARFWLVRRPAHPNEGLIDWLLACPEKDFFVPIESD